MGVGDFTGDLQLSGAIVLDMLDMRRIISYGMFR